MRKHPSLRLCAFFASLCFFSSTSFLSAAVPVTGQIDSLTPISDSEYELVVRTADGETNRFLVMASTLVQTSVPAGSVKTGSQIIPPKRASSGETKSSLPLEMPKMPELPEMPEIPQIPKIPDMPKPIDLPQMPEKPEIPDIPQVPGMKQAPPGKMSPPEAAPEDASDQSGQPPAMMPTSGEAPKEKAGAKKEAPKDEMPPPDPFMTEPKTLEKATSEGADKTQLPEKKSAPQSPSPFKKVLGVTKTESSVNIEIENGGKKEALTLALKENVLTSLRQEELREEMTVTVDFVEEEDHEVAKMITVVRN